MIGKNVFGGPNKWDGYEIVMHSGAEHTIDGKRHDFELQIFHTVHQNTEEEGGAASGGGGHRRNLAGDAAKAEAGGHGPKEVITEGGYYESAISVLFSIDEADEVSKEESELFELFLNDLELGKTNPHVEKIHFGRLMEIIDWSHRWAYKGSSTIPPCDQYIYWNVLQKIYPIKKHHVENFKKKLEEVNVDIKGLSGNWREVQTGFNKDVIFIGKSSATKIITSMATFAATLVYLY